jgi:sigma-E factor negative regulatory protein RseB
VSHLHHKVSALIDGELGPGARSRALRHARRCDLCRREISETLEVKERLSQLPPADVSFDLRELVAAGAAAAPEGPAPSLGPAFRRMAVSVGSMSVFVFALAYVVGTPEITPAAAVTPPVNEFTAEFTDSTGLAPLSDPPVDPLMETTSSTTPVGFGFSARVTPTGRKALQVKSSGPSAAASVDEVSAIALLRKAVAAPERISFRGVRRCHSYGDVAKQSFTVAVRHVAAQGTTYRVRGESAFGDRTFFIGTPTAAHATAAYQAIDRLAATYDLVVAGGGQVLGRPVTIVTASQAGELRARFWIDDATGLLLRRDLYAQGRPVRTSAYTSLQILHHSYMRHLPPEVAVPPSRRISTRIAAVLTDRGWSYPPRLAGSFRITALRQVGSTGRVMSADYTDGLSTLSVFEERGTLDASALPGLRQVRVGDRVFYVREGVPMTVVWQSGDTVFTVVTDLPEPMTAELLSRFPSPDQSTSGQSAAGSVTDRVGKGLSRLVSAVAP